MPPGEVRVGQSLFELLDEAFDAASAAQATAYSRVTDVEGSLSGAWTSEQAQPQFRAALQSWLDGFRTLQEGMNDMRQSMLTYARSTNAVEDDAIAQANFVANLNGK
jgi:hypothetical protein